MKKYYLIFLLFFGIMTISSKIYCQEPLWKISSEYEKAGNYLEAIRVKKQMAKDDYGTEWFIDDIASIARCYSYTSENDSTLHYALYAIDLAKDPTNITDSVAEEYIQNSAWCLYDIGCYGNAVTASEMVLSLRDKLYGKYSMKYVEWLGVMSYQAFKHHQLDDMVKFCKAHVDIAREAYGVGSMFYKEAISSIRTYAHQLVDTVPDFTTEWILPYYLEIHEADILQNYQYEFEILQLEGFLTMNNLQSSDLYARKLERWTYPSNFPNIPLEDRVRISLKLANHYLHMGDHIKSRVKVENAWKYLEDANAKPSIAQLIDRHIVEMQLRMDTLGRTQINAEWIIETATPIIDAGIEEAAILALFYESRAWAYEGLNDFDRAISDITKAISLNPLYSKKKKLAQFHLHKKEYDLAESMLLDLYNDPNVPEVGIKSIESDLTSLYWLWGKQDKLSTFLSKDFINLKSDIRNAFAFMAENEREQFLEKSLLGSTVYFDMYTSNSHGKDQWQIGNQMAYNLALVQKGLLLGTTRDIDSILQNAPDSIQTKRKEYEQLKTLFGNQLFGEDRNLREKRIELMHYVRSQPHFMAQLNCTWEDVRDHLNNNEAAIEFINLWGVTPENMENGIPTLGVLILRKDSYFPVFIKLGADSSITNLFEFDEEGSKVCEVSYSTPLSNQLYELIWAPLMPYLNNIETVYYAPTGILHDVNLDWIGSQDSYPLSEKYNLYRVSSTKEICKSKDRRPNREAILYGDITYSINSSTSTKPVKSRYRNSTRAGFSPLKGTAEELDSITDKFNVSDIKTNDYRQLHATEQTFQRLSGHSPEIIHIATHGFYYSQNAIEKEFESGNFSNFIAFQGMMNPELYHSGLALSGAQDTWQNESGDISKYTNMDSSNDGILLSAEISKIDLSNTDLVVLSACETALGEIKAEGVYGLQRAFKLAGVNSIIMSLWKVDDEATQMLMTSFYHKYLNGMSKREALLSAQKQVRNTPGFEDPYNWAAFILLDGLN